MKNPILLFLVSAIFLSQTAQAVDPTPGDKDVKEKIENVKESGAIKVEETLAVTEESLKATPAQAPAPILSTHTNNEHLFGIHAALAVPHPLSFGANYVHSSHLFSAEFSMGSFGGTFSDTKVKLQNTEVALRWHPWAGSFYLGAIYGNQKITAEKTEYIAAAAQNVNAKVDVKSNYLTPHFGWAWGAQSTGFFSSIEFGYQSPAGVKTDFSTDAAGAAQATQDYKDLEKDVREQGDNIGNMGLPHMVLVKIGWLF